MPKSKSLWAKIPVAWKKELMSAFHTFVPAFLGALYFSFQATGSVEWTKEALLAVLLAALRAGFKALSQWFFARFGKTS